MHFNRLSKQRAPWTWLFERPSCAGAGLIGKENECVRLDERPQAGQVHEHCLKDERTTPMPITCTARAGSMTADRTDER